MIEPEMITKCPRHPSVATNLRCAACGELICHKCLVQTPVGAKCRRCSSARGVTLFNPSPLQATAAVAVGLLAGALAGWAVEFSAGFFMILLSFVYGGFVAEMIMRAAGRKRGIRMEVIAAVSLAVGALGGRLLIAAIQLSSTGHIRPPYGIFSVIVDLVLPIPIPLIVIVIVIATAVSRIRYL